MKILVNDIAASSGGAKSILLEFYRFLIDSNDKNQWYFLLSEQIVEETENIHVILLPQVKKNWCSRLWFDCVSGRKLVARIAPDVVLSLQNTMISCGNVPQYIYVHQPLPFQHIKKFSFFKRTERIYAVYQYLIGFLIKQSIRRAKGVFVQTRWMKDAVAGYIAQEKIAVIAPSICVEEVVDQSDVQMQFDRFFYPANGAVYKNHDAIIKAVKTLTEEGITDFQVDLTLETPTDSAAIPEQIACVGTLSREAVMEHYRRKILLFPSFIETFGLPLAEARLMKGMIFAADTPFAREILDGYENAWFFDPFDPTQLKELMKKAICGELRYQPTAERPWMPESAWAELINTLKG